ncbi:MULTISPECIES: DUF3937 family protein [Bacillus cereus group]|uniref:DUF3937 domain-containing protein n=1 Tax=Bacillus cereus VD118 TaxID=1053231 RepID=R8QWK1_BACCE|nr:MULTISPECIES: DUF3937 family protein [Bacillus cereus group]EOP75420.1 hypothetical protein IIQ_05513 [Bacillus cereus VD118]MBJ8009634.1 DUF3937 family protein [Bacillus cereus]MBJ8072696.1 DUF3937 family protein [Bacillus cereus]MBJ8189684.1 DUF3937 family protein [Bacillus cereus]MDM5460274.1 DUF3937 family protein [Bacillus cereus]
MFTNKKVIRIGLGLYIFLSVIQFTIGYIKGYTGNVLLISGTWKTVLLDAPEGILVILGAIALYQCTKKLPEKTASM